MTFDSLLALILFSVGGSLFLFERVPLFQREEALIEGRWITNLGLMIIGGLVFALFIPVSLYAAAEMQASGLLSKLNIPSSSQIILVFLFLDVWRYWEHRIFHKIPLFWRVHLVHHSDTFVDVTTSERHHPLEALITTPLAILLVFALGLPTEGLAVYLIVATVSSLWVHSNLRVPGAIDTVLRVLLVTPTVHAIHHSSEQRETNSNYGSVLTIWDRLFNTYTDPIDARIPHFGLDYFHQVRDNTLTQALLQPVLYQKEMTYPPREAQSEPVLPANSPSLSREWQQTLLYGALGLALASLAMWPTITNLIFLWSSSDLYQYAWLVLPFLVYVLGWHYRDEVLSLSPQPGFSGIALIAGGIALWLVAAIVHIDTGRYVAFVLVLQGILISMLGPRIWWRLFPVFALLFFMIPSGDVLQLPLRILTVNMIDWFASAANLPHSIEGFVVYVGDHRYVVVNECSGLTFVTLATFLGYSWAILLYRSFSKVVGLALLGGLLGIGANALRVNTIVWLDWVNGTQMELSEHSNIHLIILILLLGVLFLIVSRLQPESRMDIRHRREQIKDFGQSRKGYAPVVAGLLVVSTVGLAQLMMSTSRDELHLSGVDLAPINLNSLSSSESSVRWDVDEQSRAGSLRLSFRGELDVLIVQALPGNNKLPRSGLVPRGDKVWREANIESQTACQHEHCINFIHTTWNRKDSNDVRHIFYAYYVGDLITDSKLIYRMAAGWNRLMGLNQKSGMISFFPVKEPPTLKKLADAYIQIKAQI